MEFDKSKILTAVTADSAKQGDKGWVADSVEGLERQVLSNNAQELMKILGTTCAYRFEVKGGRDFLLFYPAPEPTYRPFKNAKEFKPYCDKWFSHKEEGYVDSIGKAVDYTDLGVTLCDPHSNGDNMRLKFYFWGDFFKKFTCDGEPCGIKEEV